MHRAADEINAALAAQPGDPLLEELLLKTYQDELAVLASVNQLTGSPGASAATARQEKDAAMTTSANFVPGRSMTLVAGRGAARGEPGRRGRRHADQQARGGRSGRHGRGVERRRHRRA